VVLFINEFLASNASYGQDETGAYPDWVEIYNPGPADVEMGGLFLSDDLAASTKWAFPDTLLAAGEFMIVWCDEDTQDGPLHAGFKLGAGGEDLALFGRLAAGNELIDGYSYGPQSTDISEGRQPDGGASWVFFDTPTPGAGNEATDVGAPTPAPLSLSNFPNPFNPTTRISFNLPEAGQVRLAVFDLQGRRLAMPIDGTLDAGRHEINWDGRDADGRALASGIYFTRLSTEREQRMIRMVLLR
ncbi:MAG: T9SS type A sorting domain-containing protein, partial [bacterium]|nr:T9SS type A sorting domain-containing protein [bacterium]